MVYALSKRPKDEEAAEVQAVVTTVTLAQLAEVLDSLKGDLLLHYLLSELIIKLKDDHLST